MTPSKSNPEIRTTSEFTIEAPSGSIIYRDVMEQPCNKYEIELGEGFIVGAVRVKVSNWIQQENGEWIELEKDK
jgi:hypothetical protein